MSFKDRFKDKTTFTGKHGEHAVLPGKHNPARTASVQPEPPVTVAPPPLPPPVPLPTVPQHQRSQSSSELPRAQVERDPKPSTSNTVVSPAPARCGNAKLIMPVGAGHQVGPVDATVQKPIPVTRAKALPEPKGSKLAAQRLSAAQVEEVVQSPPVAHAPLPTSQKGHHKQPVAAPPIPDVGLTDAAVAKLRQPQSKHSMLPVPSQPQQQGIHPQPMAAAAKPAPTAAPLPQALAQPAQAPLPLPTQPAHRSKKGLHSDLLPRPSFSSAQLPTAPVNHTHLDLPSAGAVGSYNYAAAIDGTRQTKQREVNSPEADEQSEKLDRKAPNYKPYTLEDYKRMQDEVAKMKLSRGLGPSDTDEQRAEREKRQRMKEYGDNIAKVNKVLELRAEGNADEKVPKTISQPTPQEVIEAQQRRERALQFAKQVPKPKPKPTDPTKPTQSDEGEEDSGRERGISDMEAKHKHDQGVVEAIKRQLKMQ